LPISDEKKINCQMSGWDHRRGSVSLPSGVQDRDFVGLVLSAALNSSAALMLSFADASKNWQPRFFASAPHLTSLANETSELMEETIMYRSAYKYRFA
jgi:hypothetical protein